MKTSITLVLLFSLSVFGKIHAQFPVVKWWFDTKDASFGQSAAGDIDGDGKLEIVFGCYRNDGNVYALNAENGTLLWKYNTHPPGAEGCNDVAPVIFDVDNDGLSEVIAPSSCNPATFCFDGRTGEVKWQCKTAGSDSPPVIGDIDNDGKPEILHGQFGGYVICIDPVTGGRKWNMPVDTKAWVQTAPTILDVDGDGQLDFVAGTWNLDTSVNSKFYAFKGDTQAMLWSYPIGSYIYHGTTAGDIDGDGKPELIVGAYNDTLYCLNAATGVARWKYKGGGGYIGAPAVIADLDANGSCDIVFSSGYVVGALTNTGNLIWKYTLPFGETVFRGAAVADVNGDEFKDVVFGTSQGKVIALDGRTGNEIWKMDLAAHSGITGFALDHAPLIADFDGDSLLDVFIVGGYTNYPEFQNNRGRAYMLTVGKGNGPDWLMFQHDIRRQSTLCGSLTTAVHEQQLSPEATIRVVYNPLNNKAIVYFPEGRGAHPLTLFNLFGQRVAETEAITGGTAELPLGNLGAGVYFIVVYSPYGIVGREKLWVD